MARPLSDEELRVLREFRRLARPRKRLGYMRKIMVIKPCE